MTKYTSRQDLLRQLQIMGFRTLSGRPSVSNARTTAWDISRPIATPTMVSHDRLSIDDVCVSSVDGDLVHGHMQSVMFEGYSLCPDRPIPDIQHRTLYSLLDLNTGEWLYDHHDQPSNIEPDFRDLLECSSDRPWILATWAIN